MRKVKNGKILFLILLVMLLIVLFFIQSARSNVAIEAISGTVSGISQSKALFLDITPYNDMDNDGVTNNDFDVLVSSYNPFISKKLSNLRVGNEVYARDLWTGRRTQDENINHYYVIEIYSVKE